MVHGTRVPVLLAVLLATLFTAVPPLAHASVQTIDGIWSALPTEIAAPSARREHAAIYDVSHGRYLFFGGMGYESTAPEWNFDEVWTLTLGADPAWSELVVAGTAPGPRKGAQWGYDIARDRLLIFGGYGQAAAGSPVTWLDDVWELSLAGDAPAWTRLEPGGTPPGGRLAGVSVYDPLRQRFVGFGGVNGGLTSTWALDLSGDPAWIELDPDFASPPGSYGMGSIYDPVRDRMVVFGGSTGWDYFGTQNSVWELTLGEPMEWHLLIPSAWDSTCTTLPKPRRSMSAIYDPMRDRMVIYGGFDGLGNQLSDFLGDTWALSLADLQWQELQPAGTTPTGRDATAAIYDPTGDRMVFFGGWSGGEMLGDTEYLTWGDAPAAATILGSGSVVDGAASVSWNVSRSTGTTCAVFRSAPGEPWTSIATVQASPTGVVSFIDPDVVAGIRYSYELAVASQRGSVVGGRVTVDVPVAAVTPASFGFALEPVRPNPLVDRFKVAFTLPDGGPARLDVIDPSGRRVAAQEVGSSSAGRHEVDLGATRDFAPGIYFVRLSHGGRTLTTRAAVVGR